jgi:hypothetical protein
LDGVAGCGSVSALLAAFALRLYREIKSCPSAFVAVAEVVCAAGMLAEGIATWGWNDGGGYRNSLVDTLCLV